MKHKIVMGIFLLIFLIGCNSIDIIQESPEENEIEEELNELEELEELNAELNEISFDELEGLEIE